MEIELYLIKLETGKKNCFTWDYIFTMYHEKCEGHKFAQSLKTLSKEKIGAQVERVFKWRSSKIAIKSCLTVT